MHIPFEKLPPDLQEKVMVYLETDNFQAAKHLRDQYETYLEESSHQKMAKNVKSKTSGESIKDGKVFFTV